MSNTSQMSAEAALSRSGILRGPNGLRAGWRLLIFFAIFFPLVFAIGKAIDPLTRAARVEPTTPLGGTIMFAPFVAVLLLATWIMARMEHRGFADYGLPWRKAFRRQFWQGAAISFVSITALLVAMHMAGVYSFGPIALRGSDIWKYAAAWTVPVFIAALLEDFTYRGYLLFTLGSGIGFWPAAVVTSLLMGGMHYFNPGGHGLGPVAATVYCLVTCLVLRKTGDLWMPLGLHAGWSWCELYFYGVDSSGFQSTGRLFQGSLHGGVLLTGGAFGIEASVFNLLLLAIWAVLFAIWPKNSASLNLAGRISPPSKPPAAALNRTFKPLS